MDTPSHAPAVLAFEADWRLAQRALAQRPSAWMELVQVSQGLVMGLLVRHVRPQEREDLFQDVFLRIHRHLGSYRGEAALSTWIYQITMNVIRTHWDLVRRRAAREVLAADWLGRDARDREEAWDVPVEANQEHGLMESEQESRLKQLSGLVSTLTPMERQIILLRDVDGCPYAEIAARLRLPLGTVKSRLARARTTLAEALAREDRRAP